MQYTPLNYSLSSCHETFPTFPTCDLTTNTVVNNHLPFALSISAVTLESICNNFIQVKQHLAKKIYYSLVTFSLKMHLFLFQYFDVVISIYFLRSQSLWYSSGEYCDVPIARPSHDPLLLTHCCKALSFCRFGLSFQILRF